MRIILISGKAEAGKSLTAHILKEKFEADGLRCCIVPYGDYVKSTARLLWDWNGSKDEYGRQILQYWGTEMVRAKHPTFWVDTVKRLADIVEPDFDYFIIDDCRFPDEIEEWNNWVKLTVRVERPGHENALSPSQRVHTSETALDDYPFAVRLVATTKEALVNEIQEKLIPVLSERRVSYEYHQQP